MNNEDGRPFDHTDELVSTWLDDPAGRDAGINLGVESSESKQRVADLLWIHALLERGLRQDSSRLNQQIERAMDRIRHQADAMPTDAVTGRSSETPQTEAIGTRSRSQIRRMFPWVTAAVIFVGIGLCFQIFNSSRQAHAAVDQIRQAAKTPEDREYAVTLQFAGLRAADPTQRNRTIEATLFVRGGEAFVAKAPAVLRSGEVWFGRNPQEFWFKPVIGPVLAGPGALAMQERFLQYSENTPPFLQITTVLDRLSDHYKVQLLPDEVPVRGKLSPVAACRRVSAHLRTDALPPHALLPDVVEIHADRLNGNIIRMVLQWNRQTTSMLSQMTFDFVQQSRQPDLWYRPAGHMAGDGSTEHGNKPR